MLSRLSGRISSPENTPLCHQEAQANHHLLLSSLCFPEPVFPQVHVGSHRPRGSCNMNLINYLQDALQYQRFFVLFFLFQNNPRTCSLHCTKESILLQVKHLFLYF